MPGTTFIYFHILSPILALLLSIAIQFICLKAIARLDFYKSIWFGFCFGFFALLGLEVCFISLEQKFSVDLVVTVVVNCVCFFMMQICYFLFVNSVVSALQVRIIDELSKSNEGLTLAEIFWRYKPEEIIQNRIDKWSNARQILVKENRCYIDRRSLLYVAKIFDCMKVIIFGIKFQRVRQDNDT